MLMGARFPAPFPFELGTSYAHFRDLLHHLYTVQGMQQIVEMGVYRPYIQALHLPDG